MQNMHNTEDMDTSVYENLCNITGTHVCMCKTCAIGQSFAQVVQSTQALHKLVQ